MSLASLQQGMEQASDTGALIGAAVGGLFALVVGALVLVGFWKVFTKAGEPGWATLVPFYNLWVLVKISGKPTWWFGLFFIPLANFIATILVWMGVAKSFGKGSGFGLGLIFFSPIFIPLLGFSDARYQGVPQQA